MSVCLTEHHLPRGGQPQASVVHPVCDLQLLPLLGTRARLQHVQHDHGVRPAAPRHRHLVRPHPLRDDQEDAREQRYWCKGFLCVIGEHAECG